MNTPPTTTTQARIAQFAIIGIGLYALFLALYYTKDFVVPLLFATIFAILLEGVVSFLVRKMHFPRLLAICIVLFVAMACALGIIMLIGYQGSTFLEDIPKLLDRIGKVFTDVTHWVGHKTGVSDKKIDELYEQTKQDQMKKSSVIVRNTLTNLNDVLAVLFLLPVYIFMLLFYKTHLLIFVKEKLFHPERHRHIGEILSDIKTLVQFYLLGLMTELVMVSGLNALGLFIIGVDYALLLGLISGIMNLIPYIGSILAGALAAVVALSMPDSGPFDALWVIASFSFVQFVDNTFFVPLIVGSRVKLNALVSLVGVVAGGTLWGIPGMILSIPLLGILKAISDKTEILMPLGYLLGDRETPEEKTSRIAKSVARLKKKT